MADTPDEQVDDLEALNNLTTPFDADGRAFLARTQKFLLNMMDPSIGGRAAKFGYSDAQHAAGWELLSIASGKGRPFAHFLSEAEQEALAMDPTLKAVIAGVDDFENTWFPVIAVTIQRYVAEAQREAVKEAFYKGLQQQPEGPLVINSVTLLLERLEGLKTSNVPGADKAYAALVEKGLTDEAITRVKALIEKAKAAARPQAPKVSADELRNAAATQLKAFQDLRFWYADWATTLRPKFGYRERVRLGLQAAKGGRKPKGG